MRVTNNLQASALTMEADTEIVIEYYSIRNSSSLFDITVTSLETAEASRIEVLNTELATLGLECDDVLINGVLTAGALDSYAQYDSFETGDASQVTFTPATQNVLAGQTFRLGGQLTLNALMDFDNMVYLEVKAGAVVTMTEEASSSGSIVMQVSNTANIDGTFVAPVPVDFTSGTPDFLVGSTGTFEFVAATDFVVDNLQVDGNMTSLSSLRFAGRGSTKVENIEIGAGGMSQLT